MKHILKYQKRQMTGCEIDFSFNYDFPKGMK